MLFSNVKALVFWFLQICAPDPPPPPPPLDLSWGKGSVHRPCSLFSFSPLATLVTRGEPAPKCVPHLLLGSLMERGSQPLAIFSLSLVTVPEVFPKLTRLSSSIYSSSFWLFLKFYFYSSPCTIRWRDNWYKCLKDKCCYPVMACRTKKWPYKVWSKPCFLTNRFPIIVVRLRGRTAERRGTWKVCV